MARDLGISQLHCSGDEVASLPAAIMSGHSGGVGDEAPALSPGMTVNTGLSFLSGEALGPDGLRVLADMNISFQIAGCERTTDGRRGLRAEKNPVVSGL